MALPLAYNVRSVRVRWVSAIVAVLGIAGAVSVFVAMLSLARGFQATLVASGSPRNAVVRRAGATSELDSAISVDQVRVVEDAPGVARGSSGPLTSAELVVVASFAFRTTGSDASVQVRGVSPRAREVREGVRLTAGRFFRPDLPELVVGRHAAHNYAGLELGGRVRFGGSDWAVVGIFDAGGSAFDSELWCDASMLAQVYQRQGGIVQSVTARLASPADFERFEAALTSDPRLTLQVDREVEYYAKQSLQITTLILVLGTVVAAAMGVGAVFAALNTMYSAVAERSREIATLRALGFPGASVVVSFQFEALLIAAVGGLLGCALVLPLNGLTTGTLNLQSFSHLAFAFRITPDLLAGGVGFALLMGLLGGLPPALRAVRRPIAAGLREL